MGKHSMVQTAQGFAKTPAFKGAAAATVAGMFVGMGSSVAMAAPSETKVTQAVPAVEAASVDLSQEVSASEKAVESSGWKLDASQIDVEKKDEPVAQRSEANTTQTAPGAQNNASAAFTTFSTADSVSGAGGSTVLSAALAQIGRNQDCTALVENALRGAGYSVGDLGTGIWQYDQYGSRVSTDALAPGDILIYGNAASGAHVAVYAGNGQAVHGGYLGYATVVAGVGGGVTGAIRPS